MTVCHQKVPSWWIFKKPFIFLNFHETLQKSDTSIFSNFHDSGHKNQILPFSLSFMTPGKGKKIKNQWSLNILKMKKTFEKEKHFENERSFRKTFWKWKHTYGKVRICKWQCTLIRGVIVIHPGLKYGLFHYTLVHFDHILSGIQISTIADFSSMHSGEFCPLLQISSFPWLFSWYHGSIWNIFGSW